MSPRQREVSKIEIFQDLSGFNAITLHDSSFKGAFFEVCVVVFLTLALRGTLDLRATTEMAGARIKSNLTRLHSWCVPVILFLVSFGVNAFLYDQIKPSHFIHDERAHLLAAETFLSGRLTNVAHPFWWHFESFHIIQQPTYQSKYPIGQALVLAGGKLFFGNYGAGLWLVSAVSTVVAFWCLSAWFSVPLAALLALIASTKISFSYFTLLYLGGPLAFLAGALLVGGMKRYFDKPSYISALNIGLAGLIFSISRPYEGSLLLAASVGYLAVKVIRGFRSRHMWRHAGLFTLILGVAVGLNSSYNKVVTGHSWLFPYQAHDSAYMQTPVFLWQTIREIPHSIHPEIDRLYSRIDFVLKHGWQRESLRNFLIAGLAKMWVIVSFFCGSALLPVFVFGAYQAIKSRGDWFCLVILLLLVFTELSITYVLPHYAASMAIVFYILIGKGLYLLWGRAKGGFESSALVSMVLAGLLVAPSQFPSGRMGRSFGKRWTIAFAEVHKQLDEYPGKKLVVVKYTNNTIPHFEWVYNSASIDSSEIVFARDMESGSNAKLSSFFHDRKLFELVVDDTRGAYNAILRPL